jgi:hypothetical protein
LIIIYWERKIAIMVEISILLTFVLVIGKVLKDEANKGKQRKNKARIIMRGVRN